ncbi:LysR family transcriptional regulator [Hyphomonas chukchiensis]|uniref:HTH lysR-type domain-containing protein n=1 Tax=Hyphomonas chukchiensis TaxID=1280947 RepID=A0A062UNN0_9PROT|nr:LysR family transcriptional regulator [Hyphomonas chukchiensis]KCZ57700.1 hypothetical protein HY30_17410 [Hyphomonas chukchiensis]|tara:strand:- start:502 stop:1380 length:879 start_codon:yes stop_codon:yes gene_type:complete
MNWDDLKLFLAVSRQPKLEQAAANLHQDATTLSRRLRRLETDLGQTLFERTRRGHILTHEGEALAQHAEAMEALSFRIRNASEMEQTVSGKIRLGVTEGLGSAVIAPALADFAETWPGIELDLIALSGFVSVSRREADMSILLTRPKAGRLKVKKLTDYTLCLYASAGYLERQGPVRKAEELANHRLIGYVDDLIYSPQLRYFDEVLPGLHASLSSPSILAQTEMTRAGAGLCILPKFIAGKHAELIPVLPDAIEVKRSFWLSIHEDVAPFARIKILSDYLTELVRLNAAEL